MRGSSETIKGALLLRAPPSRATQHQMELRPSEPYGAPKISLTINVLLNHGAQGVTLALVPRTAQVSGSSPGSTRKSPGSKSHRTMRRGLQSATPRQAERLRVPAGAHRLEGRADLDRSRPPQSRSHEPRRPRRQDRDLRRHQRGRPAARDARDPRRPHPRRIGTPAAGAADPGLGLRHETHLARGRLRQAQGAIRACGDRPARADWSVVGLFRGPDARSGAAVDVFKFAQICAISRHDGARVREKNQKTWSYPRSECLL